LFVIEALPRAGTRSLSIHSGEVPMEGRTDDIVNNPGARGSI
jgi:hypothetical protein